MTEQEAKKIIKDVMTKERDKYFSSTLAYKELSEAMEITIMALEKQIAKKPNTAIDSTWGIKREVPVCPVCDYYLTQTHWLIDDGATETEKVTYCETCGQAINWE